MTPLLEHAVSEARKLPESAQDAIAVMILEQIADDRGWDESFARSQEELVRMARKVREDIAAGRVRRLSN
jgi:hypothetical protein